MRSQATHAAASSASSSADARRKTSRASAATGVGAALAEPGPGLGSRQHAESCRHALHVRVRAMVPRDHAVGAASGGTHHSCACNRAEADRRDAVRVRHRDVVASLMVPVVGLPPPPFIITKCRARTRPDTSPRFGQEPLAPLGDEQVECLSALGLQGGTAPQAWRWRPHKMAQHHLRLRLWSPSALVPHRTSITSSPTCV